MEFSNSRATRVGMCHVVTVHLGDHLKPLFGASRALHDLCCETYIPGVIFQLAFLTARHMARNKIYICTCMSETAVAFQSYPIQLPHLERYFFMSRVNVFWHIYSVYVVVQYKFLRHLQRTHWDVSQLSTVVDSKWPVTPLYMRNVRSVSCSNTDSASLLQQSTSQENSLKGQKHRRITRITISVTVTLMAN